MTSHGSTSAMLRQTGTSMVASIERESPLRVAFRRSMTGSDRLGTADGCRWSCDRSTGRYGSTAGTLPMGEWPTR